MWFVCNAAFYSSIPIRGRAACWPPRIIQVLVLYIVCFWALCLYRYQSVNFFVPVMKQGVKRLVLLYVTVWLFVRLTLFKITGHVRCCTVLNNGTKWFFISEARCILNWVWISYTSDSGSYNQVFVMLPQGSIMTIILGIIREDFVPRGIVQ